MELLERSRAAHFWLALALCAVGVTTVITTFLPGAPYVPEWLVMTSFGLAFPVAGAALIRDAVAPTWAQRKKGGWRRSLRQTEAIHMMASVPQPARGGVIAVFLMMWLAALSSFFAGPAGQPTEVDGRYFVNNHGDVREITAEEYDRAVASSTRGFAAVPAAFFAFAAASSRYGPLSAPSESEATPPG